jgi:cobalt-zinc-cadmium efflux system outer membrane protein
MMYSIKRMIWICLLLPMSLAAQEKPVLSLDTIIQRIDRHHPMLQIYDLKAGSYKHAAEAATAWMAPMAGVGTFMTPYPGQTLMAGDDRGSLMFQLEQDIPSLAKLNARREYIGSKADAETESRSIALNTYRTQAKKLYFSWLIARERMAILENNERILQTMHKIEEIRYPFNRSKLSDVYLTESKIEENRNMVLMQKAEIEQARALLNSLMNEQIDTEFEIDTLYRPEFVPATATDTGSLASHRSDIRKMDYGIRSAQLNMESVKLQNRPDFSLRLDLV